MSYHWILVAPEVTIDGDHKRYLANGTDLLLKCQFNALPTVSATWLSLDEKYLTWPTNTSVTLSGSFSSATLWALSQSWLWTYLKHDWIGHISLTSKRERLIWKGVQRSLINFKRCAKNYTWETSARFLFTNYNKNWVGFFLWQKLQPNRTSVTDMMNQWNAKKNTGDRSKRGKTPVSKSMLILARVPFFFFTQSLY